MTRRLEPGRLVIASHNKGKIREIADLLGPFGIEPVSAASLDLPEPEETGTSFIANAELKALLAADLSGLPALADDSGLCVEALNGDPGIFSARWAGEGKDFAMAMQRVWQEVEARGPDAGYDAHFVCALCVAWPDGHTESFEGRVDGRIVWPPRGDQGFGYDPFFVPVGHAITFGEMEPDAKHGMSHRAHAFAQLKALLL
ncbi:RdgB/HAM1 family non-canonical purine NTP pyrophosphatase [Sphingobium sufflavum]|uniref:RdgB/HAM1 family non-canonical purine NTP pyrophosphatase n=1 Tax=Sphingobium sufflavum TaxID=1129547 RepID=UPI001F3DE397|nr:RdgB/HAM1 family non-canonical purine NTP pyrophosphatase [Sphingobium sufflavum]MCE7795094.1 RdgB/HAM1 family non-canonical purine NTP pyrophosphatase [Sphingobium sufflavum]